MKYVYGPVRSRRLGLSLGIDVIERKACNLGCVYCQLGKTYHYRARRFQRVKLEILKQELHKAALTNPALDYITISGSGEPTLHKDLDRIISTTKEAFAGKYPVCVITNSSLLYRPQIRKELCWADVVMPSLDAPNEQVFEKINRPYRSVSLNRMIEGLVHFRREFKRIIFLEIMLVRGFNDEKEYAYQFKKLIGDISPDKIYLNIPVRPTPLMPGQLMPSSARVKYFKRILGNNCEVVSSKDSYRRTSVGIRRLKMIVGKPSPAAPVSARVFSESIIDSLKRRPQTVNELAESLVINRTALLKVMARLLNLNRVYSFKKRGNPYYAVKCLEKGQKIS